MRVLFPLILLQACLVLANFPVSAAEPNFKDVWTKVGERTCLQCHKIGGEAEESKFLLLDLKKSTLDKQSADLRFNQDAFTRMAKLEAEGHQSRLLLKAQGKLKHGGKEQLKPGSDEFKLLSAFVKEAITSTLTKGTPPPLDKNAPPFFQGVRMVKDKQLLRKVTLSLAGRLPEKEELAQVEKEGLKAIPALLDKVMKEESFYERLREAFNDIFLTVGYDDVPENALSYEHFSTTRHWYQRFDFSHIKDEKEKRQAGYKLADEYRKAILGEPMKLIEHIVSNDKPFTEIVTADYIMVTPFTARGYGIYEEIKQRFKNPDSPFEYIPVKLKALHGRTPADHQDSKTGFYGHAGLLSTFQYLKRYPTTETNRNRLRARVYFQQFLGVDVLELAARVSDAAAVTAKYEIPTMQATECVVCHKSLDPVAGLFQDYWKFEGVYGKRKGGWFKDMFSAGFEGEELPTEERWRALQWLGERTAKDPRFASTMVEHAWYLLSGQKPLLAPKDFNDPLYKEKRRAYEAQRQEIEKIASHFAKEKFNFKIALKDLVLSDFYRADGLATLDANPQRKIELEDVGIARMLAPEQLERKIAAVFGKPWGRLREQMAMLYGGIDSKEVTERAADPSGAMGAIQRILSNDVACREVALDFSKNPADRLLFPGIEPTDLPGTSEADNKIRSTLVHLHQRVLGLDLAKDSIEVTRAFELFSQIVRDASERKGIDPRETYSCRQNLVKPVPDPNYTVRAWRAVVTYLLRQPEFLYE